MSVSTAAHPSWSEIVDYWLGDTELPLTEAIDEHLLHCDACGAVFDEVVALSHAVRDAFAHGLVPTAVTPGFIDRLRAAGVRVREYHVPRNGSVLCSVAPEDDVLVGRMQVPLAGVARLDALVTVSLEADWEQRLQDLPFDASAGEVLLVSKIAEVR
ncbi:MAG TPA: hypothetical protein VNN09_10785, partial [Candidatus Competibacteraceae bacterium]|nr:hypothetical protein [Candidatus Competibacteraceae bacterium]